MSGGRWRIGVPRPHWRPSHEIRSHHFDRQPFIAYLPGLLAIACVAYVNSRRQENSKDEARVEADRRGADRVGS